MDARGFTIVHKRLERGTFSFPERVVTGAASIELDAHELVPTAKKRGPTGRLLKAFEAASSLPKRQKQLVEQFVSTLVAQRKAG